MGPKDDPRSKRPVAKRLLEGSRDCRLIFAADWWERSIIGNGQLEISNRQCGSVSVLGHMSSDVGILVAIFGDILGNDAAEQHAFIRFAKSLFQLRLHLVPTQAAG